MDITGVGSSSYLYGYGISDSDTKNVTGKENGIGSVDENRRNARPVKTVNMSTDQMKQMYRLRVPRMFPRRLHHRQSVHMRGSMYPMPTARHPRKMAG